MKWFRLYSELIDDPKQAKMKDKTFRVFILLMCLANELDLDGEINLTTREISWRLRILEKNIAKTISELILLDVLLKTQRGYSFKNWAKRNFRSDNVSSRVRKFREKSETLHETLPDLKCNVIDTEKSNINTLSGSNGNSPKIPYREIIAYLNDKTGKKFHWNTKETQKHIRARWDSGFRLEDFKRVIDIKTLKWKTDPKMCDYLRPETLFGTKFESYLNENNVVRLKTPSWEDAF